MPLVPIERVEKLSTWYSFHGEEPVDAFSASPEPIATGEALLTPADVFAPDSVRMRATARLAVRRLTNGRVSACWNSWASMAAERRKAMGQLRMSLKFLVNRKVALAFMSWLAALEASLPNPTTPSLMHVTNTMLNGYQPLANGLAKNQKIINILLNPLKRASSPTRVAFR